MRLNDVWGAAACANLLHVVDAAFARPGGPAAHRMADEVCPRCPIWEACLEFAMTHGERGPWGGTLERERRAVHRMSYFAATRTRDGDRVPATRRPH
jgi:hypothetical protein